MRKSFFAERKDVNQYTVVFGQFSHIKKYMNGKKQKQIKLHLFRRHIAHADFSSKTS